MRSFRTVSDVSFMKILSDSRCMAPKVEVLYAKNSHFQTVVNYQNFWMHDRSLTYNGRITVETVKYVKRMKTLKKGYRFHYTDPITKLKYQAQVMRVVNSNDVSDGMALWVVPNFIRDGPAWDLTVRMTPQGATQGKYLLLYVV